MHYYVGLDNGGTATKAALIDANGMEVGVCTRSTRFFTPKPGFAERDMDEMWEMNCEVIRGVIEKCQVDPADIAGVGISGHGKGLYLWGKDDRPVRYGILSTDNRAYAYPVRWRKDGTEAKAFEYSLQHIMACQPVALLAWLRDHEEENYHKIRYIFEAKDYVRFRLTGEARAEMTDYSGSGLMNLRTCGFDRELLKLFGLEEIYEALPPLCGSMEIAGTVSEEAAERCGLKAGTPVVGGMFDIDACAIGCGVADPDTACMIAGTWSINEYIRKQPVTDNTVLMNSLYAMQGYYLIEESSATSAGNLAWFVNQLLPELKTQRKEEGSSVYEDIDRWVEEIPPEEFVPVFLPFLLGTNVHPNAKACFVGMTESHTRKHLVRSVFEGITFCHRYHFEKLLRTRPSAPNVIRLAGGAARAEVWAHMFADVMQIPVEVVRTEETGCLGVAIGAAVAAGEYASVQDAMEHMTAISTRIDPDQSKKDIYNRKYSLYKQILESLDPVWENMQELVELQK